MSDYTNNKEITKEQAIKWINALRSGKYKQGKDSLQNRDGYCCLGVACDIFMSNRALIKDNLGYILGAFPEDQPYAPSWLHDINEDFALRTKERLSMLNDGDKLSSFNFNEIADLIYMVYILEVLN